MFHKVFLKTCNFLFGKQANDSLPKIWVLSFDIIVLFFAYCVSMFFIYYNSLSKGTLFHDWYRIFIVMGVYIIMFLIYHTYYGMIRYSGFDDIRKIFHSCNRCVKRNTCHCYQTSNSHCCLPFKYATLYFTTKKLTLC